MKNKINQYIILNTLQDNESGELHIEGNIYDSGWWDDDITPKNIAKAFKEMGSVKNLDIYVNSYGGSCVAGNSIVNIIDDYKKKNNCTAKVHIRGIAASMGSGIAMVGDTVEMADNALFMIHKPLADVYGNSEDFEKAIDILNKTETTLIKNYMRKFNGTEDELRQLMADETWLTAEEAKDLGFVDEISESVKVAACSKGMKIGNQLFGSEVADLMNKKYPNNPVTKKEESELTFDEKLKDYGIDEEKFNSFNLESEKVMEIANIVKEKFAVEPEKPFVAKEDVCNALECEDITSEELINFAKLGKNPPAPKENPELKNKADQYDKILASAKKDAMKEAVKAQGEFYDEARIKKALDAYDYDDIIEATKSWKEQAKKALNAGKRYSQEEGSTGNSVNEKYIDPKDCMIG